MLCADVIISAVKNFFQKGVDKSVLVWYNSIKGCATDVAQRTLHNN